MGLLSSGLNNLMSGKSFGGNTKSKDRRKTVQPMQEFKRGGKVKRTDLAKVHKGEQVLTKKQSKRYRRRSSRSKGKR